MLEFGNRYSHLMPTRNDGDAWVDRLYSAKVRLFPNGSVEVSTAIVPALQRRRHAAAAAFRGMGQPRTVAEDELTPDQVSALDKRRAEENKIRAVRRAKQQVRFAVKAIKADHLLTLTYRTVNEQPMDDLERLKADWKRFCRLIKQGLPASEKYRAHRSLEEWRFVAIREKQDNGAYHLHVAVVGRQDINFIRRCWYVAIGGSQDDSGDNTLGQINVRGPSKRWGTRVTEWKQDMLAGYMTKYLHKTFDDLEEKGTKRYWAGRSNEKPEVIQFWLAAQSFEEAILESHRISRFYSDKEGIVIWASQGYEAIWIAI